MGDYDGTPKPLVAALGTAIEVQQRGVLDEFRVATPGGRFQVRWDEGGQATPLGQLAFFAEFLEVSGVFSRWSAGCPMGYTSPNAPSVNDVLGTWLLSILDGQRRYAHVAGLRGDAVAPRLLGMNKIVSDESLRRALAHLAPVSQGRQFTESEREARLSQVARTSAWMDAALRESTQEALQMPWILDVDTTVKPLYGHQDGAEISYNPHKPGRPSHALHTYWIGQMRLVLDAEMHAGKEHAPRHGLPRLLGLLEGMRGEERPKLVRGDNAYGTDVVMAALEALGQGYLFKLKQTRGVKTLIERQWRREDWRDAGAGMEAAQFELKLMGWERARRVVVIRRAIRGDLVAKSRRTARDAQGKQQSLSFAQGTQGLRIYEYDVLVTNTEHSVESVAWLYRDRADCENGFDELKNQWGWGGYTTRDLERCDLSARAVALIYNWWSWYVRLANPPARREAITSRPLLLSGVARLTEHAGQSRLLVTLVHGSGDQIKAMIANVRAGLAHVRATAPQLATRECWNALVRYIIGKIFETKRRRPAPIGSYPPWLATGLG